MLKCNNAIYLLSWNHGYREKFWPIKALIVIIDRGDEKAKLFYKLEHCYSFLKVFPTEYLNWWFAWNLHNNWPIELTCLILTYLKKWTSLYASRQLFWEIRYFIQAFKHPCNGWMLIFKTFAEKGINYFSKCNAHMLSPLAKQKCHFFAIIWFWNLTPLKGYFLKR